MVLCIVQEMSFDIGAEEMFRGERFSLYRSEMLLKPKFDCARDLWAGACTINLTPDAGVVCVDNPCRLRASEACPDNPPGEKWLRQDEPSP